MNDEDWYELTEGGLLLQGNILMNCPVFSVAGPLSWPLSADAEIEVEAKVFDLVVMTQSCDLENEKVEDILLAQLVTWTDVVLAETQRGNEAVRSRKFRKLLVDGNVPGLSLLHQRDTNPELRSRDLLEASGKSAELRELRTFGSRAPKPQLLIQPSILPPSIT